MVGAAGLARIARVSKNIETRSAVTFHLLRDNSESALLAYLSLIRDGDTRDFALEAARQLPRPPIDRMIGLLDHDEKPVRLTAALALGRWNGPLVTQSLITRVSDKPSGSMEAWFALLGCRGNLAVEFLAYAGSQPQLLGYYNNARIHWAQWIPFSY
jgi:hypothetical protein